MRTGRNSLLNRVGAMLCVALLFVFTQAAAASTVAGVQHLTSGVGGHHHHRHMLFTDIVLDFGHADHGYGAAHHGDGAPAHQGPSHHHHGDLGSCSLLLTSSPSGLLLASSETVVPTPGRLLTKTRQHLPDRPPRTALLRV